MATTSKAKRQSNKKRTQLGVIISREMKARIAAMARKSGQSQGQVAEQMMLKAVDYESLLTAIRQGLEAELFRLGFVRVRTTDTAGKIFSKWLEPGHPEALEQGSLASQRGAGFIPPDESDPRSIEIRPYEDGTTEVITKDGSDEEAPKT